MRPVQVFAIFTQKKQTNCVGLPDLSSQLTATGYARKSLYFSFNKTVALSALTFASFTCQKLRNPCRAEAPAHSTRASNENIVYLDATVSPVG